VTIIFSPTATPGAATATNTPLPPTATASPVVRRGGAGLPSVGLDLDWTWGLAAAVAICVLALVRYVRRALPKE